MKQELVAPDGSKIYVDDDDRREFHDQAVAEVQFEIDREIIKDMRELLK